MTFLKWRPLTWLQDVTAIAGAALIAGVTATTASATTIDQGFELKESAAATATTVGQIPGTNFCQSNLDAAIDAIVNRPQFASAAWGISIEPLSEETLLYSYRSEDLLIPASNVKLLTTAAALRIVGERAPQALSSYKDQVEVINRYSDNYRADELLRHIGGQHAVHRALEPMGLTPEDYYQVDGSGLSRGNKVKPASFVALLKGMSQTGEQDIFYNSLPVGGISGTLEYRFRGTPVQGKVHAKTGTLRGVRALSGYVETPSYGTVAFSIVINQPGQSGYVMLDAIDEMVLNIAQVEPCY